MSSAGGRPKTPPMKGGNAAATTPPAASASAAGKTPSPAAAGGKGRSTPPVKGGKHSSGGKPGGSGGKYGKGKSVASSAVAADTPIADLCSPVPMRIVPRVPPLDSESFLKLQSAHAAATKNGPLTPAPATAGASPASPAGAGAAKSDDSSVDALAKSVADLKVTDSKENVFVSNVRKYFEKFAFGIDKNFKPTVSSGQRKEIHALCSSIGLQSASHGNAIRYICVSNNALLFKPPAGAATNDVKSGSAGSVVYEYFVERSGHLFFEGPCVDAAARAAHGKVLSAVGGHASWLEKREERDGKAHHITLLHSGFVDTVRANHADYKDLSAGDAMTKLLDTFARTVVDDWVDLGLGRAVDPATGNVVLFKVLNWPSANAARTALGLPASDFHITVGFQRYDMHNIPKDKSTLIPTDGTAPPATAAAATATATAAAPAS